MSVADDTIVDKETIAEEVTGEIIPQDPPDFVSDFHDTSLKGDKSLFKFKDPEALAKGYVEIEKSKGGAVAVPKADASDEEWSKFFTRTGRPKEASEYEVTGDLGEGKEISEELFDGVKTFFHSIGLSKVQGEKALEWVKKESLELAETVRKQQEITKEAGIASLKEKWGDSYVANMKMAGIAINDAGGKDLTAVWDKYGAANDPVVIESYYNIYKKYLAEDKMVNGEAPVKNGDGEKPETFAYPEMKRQREEAAK